MLGVVGLVLSVTLAGLAFFRVSWRGGPVLTPRFPIGEWLAALPAHLGWVAPFAFLMAAQPVLRALVWRRVLPVVPGVAKPGPAALYHALVFGGLVHNVLPGRLGLAASAWVLRRWSAMPFTPLLSSLLMVKLAELAALVAGAGVMVWVIDARFGGAALLGRVVLWGAAGVAVMAGAAVAAAYGAPRIVARLERGGRHPRAARLAAALGQGFGVLRSGPHLGVSLALAILPVAAGALAYGWALARLGAPAGAAGGALVLAAVTFGQLTPGLPVGVGVYYFVAAWAARQLGVSAADAAALAALSHATTAVVSLVLGATSLLIRRDTLRALVGLRRTRISTTDLLAAEAPR